MTIESISDTVKKIKIKYECSDVFSLCEEMKILLLFTPMGSFPDACKGFFFAHSGIFSITVNSDLPEISRRIIAAHELGHAVLHGRDCGEGIFHDFEIFDKASVLEYEANVFAAELLLEDKEIYELLNSGASFFDAARSFFVPPELLDFKLRIMKKKGYHVDPPMIAKSTFLKKL